MNRLINPLGWGAVFAWAALLSAQLTPPAASVTSITLAGTTSQITATGTCTVTTSGTCTLSVPSGFVLPGTINGLTITTTTGTLTIATAKVLTANNSLTLAGTDGVTLTFPSTSATIARTDAAQTFTGVQTFTNSTVTGPSSTPGRASFTSLTNLPVPARTNFTGSLGFQFTVPASITVTSLGRYYLVAGSNHVVNLWVATNTATPLATATITGAGASGLTYTSITPVTLTTGNTYSITVDETNGGADVWNDTWNVAKSFDGAFTVTARALGSASTYPSTFSLSGTNQIYDSPSFLFTVAVPMLTSGTPFVGAVTQSPAGYTLPTTVFTAEATGTAPLLLFNRYYATGASTNWTTGSYFGPSGNFESNAWIDLIGNQTMAMNYHIPSMLQVLPDVEAGIISNASGSGRTTYVLGVFNSTGNFTFSQENDGSHCWGNGAWSATPNVSHALNDVCITRTAAGALEINDNTNGVQTGTSLKVGASQTVATAVASLPTCNAGAEGMHAAVNNSNAASYTLGIGAIVAGGGTIHVPVYCDGTNWRIG